MTRRTLALRRESLVELTNGDLGQVAGGAYALTVNGLTCPLKACAVRPSEDISCNPSCGHSGCCTIDC